jgi:DNA-binding LacI/PurR family transcriptional regulator
VEQAQGNDGGWYFEQLSEGVQAAAQNAGCMLMQVRSHWDEKTPKSALRRGIQCLQARRLDGLVLPGALSGLQSHLDVAEYPELPIVVVDPARPTCYCTVDFDDAAAMRIIMDHLLKLGHRKLLWLGKRHSQMTPREGLWLRTALSAGAQGEACHYEESVNAVTEEVVRHAEQAILDYLAGDHPPFTAVTAYNDMVALGACRALARKGLRVPRDISVVGFDDSYASLAWPPLTTISHELFEMGRRAGQLVLEMIDADDNRREEMRRHSEMFAPRLVQRESTGPAPK